MKVLMCEPKYFGIEYQINPWMNKENNVHKDKAIEQWNNLKDTFIRLEVEVELIEPISGLPDMVFTANGGVVLDKLVLMSKFTYPERQGEEEYFRQWFNKNGYEVIESQFNFEGAGDALWSGKSMFVGNGFRSDIKAANRIQYELVAKSAFRNKGSIHHGKSKDIVSLTLVNPYFYHLDTCFCPLNKNLALAYPEAFSEESYGRMRQNIEVIEVCKEDAKKFACNAVPIKNNVVLPSGCSKLVKRLEQLNFNVCEVKLDEFKKSGGSARCLTLFV